MDEITSTIIAVVSRIYLATFGNAQANPQNLFRA
jgi:hypothetical protein